MEVPEAVLTGEAARLLCDYDLEQAALYSIKWYRGDEEFYRFVPKESPPTRVFPLPGIHVDISLSDARRVTLLDVSKQLTGFYKCEVSADAPLFHTEIKSATMTVVEVPEDEPEIVADRPRYSAGETIQANCSSGAAFPAPNITWFLNDQRVPVGMGNLDLPGIPVVETTVTEVGGGLETARSTMQLHTAGLGGRLRLRCEATLFTLYRRSSKEVTLPEVTPQTASVLGPSRAAAAGSESMVGMVLLVLMCSILVTSCR